MYLHSCKTLLTFCYRTKFGLYEVDMDSPERTRTPRKSAYVYKEIVHSRCLDMHYDPDMRQPLEIY